MSAGSLDWPIRITCGGPHQFLAQAEGRAVRDIGIEQDHVDPVPDEQARRHHVGVQRRDDAYVWLRLKPDRQRVGECPFPHQDEETNRHAGSVARGPPPAQPLLG
jgi:hypothetical protein